MSNSLWPTGLQHAWLPVFHYLPGFAQTLVHWVSHAIQPSHPLSLSPSPYHNSYFGTLILTRAHTIFKLSSFSPAIVCSRTQSRTPRLPVTGSSHPSDRLWDCPYFLGLPQFPEGPFPWRHFQSVSAGICLMFLLWWTRSYGLGLGVGEHRGEMSFLSSNTRTMLSIQWSLLMSWQD